jgi:hypothetical protein
VVLDSFLNTLGGKINNGKSQIYGWNVYASHIQAISKILGFPCLASWTSFNYLGMVISLCDPNSITWQGMLGKLERQL